jgi:hypothetical protein
MDLDIFRLKCQDAIKTTKDYKVTQADALFLNELCNHVEFDPRLVSGLAIAREKAARFEGGGLALPTYIEEKPLVAKVTPPKIVSRVDKPAFVEKNPITFADIGHLSRLFSRENFLKFQDECDRVCEKEGKNFEALTINDVNCDFYYDDFLMHPEVGGSGDTYDHSIKAAVGELVSHIKCEEIVTIWAEDSKALVRYAATGITKLTLLIPEGFSSTYLPNMEEWLYSAFPTIDYEAKPIARAAELLLMTSDQFVEKYSLNKDAAFIINFLPQFMHLRYAFKDFLCCFLDTSVVTDDYIRIQLPSSVDIMSAKLRDYYASWIKLTYPEQFATGHCGFYDPIARIRLSFSQHGCYFDHVRDPIDFGDLDYMVESISSFTGHPTESQLRVAYRTRLRDGSASSVPLAEDDLIELEDSADIDAVPWIFNECDSTDLSWLVLPEVVVYLPAVELLLVTTDAKGSVAVGSVVYSGFPPERAIQCYIHEGMLYVYDIIFPRKDFYSRRDYIPLLHRVKYTSYPAWDLSYAVFPFSRARIDNYSVDFGKVLDFFLDGDRTEDCVFDEYIFPTVAWNSNLGIFVFDFSVYGYGSVLEFDYSTRSRDRFFEFGSHISLKKALRFEVDDCHFEFPFSDSVKVIPPDVMQEIVSAVLDGSVLYDALSDVFSDYYVEYRRVKEYTVEDFIDIDHFSVPSVPSFDLDDAYSSTSYMNLVLGSYDTAYVEIDFKFVPVAVREIRVSFDKTATISRGGVDYVFELDDFYISSV